MDVRVSSNAPYTTLKYKFFGWQLTTQLLITKTNTQMDSYENMKINYILLCGEKNVLLEFITRKT